MSTRLSILLGESVERGLLNEKVGPKEVGAGATALGVPVGYAVIAGEAAFLSSLSLTVLGLGIAFAISHVNHVIAWKLRRKPDSDADPRDLLCLDRLLWLQLSVVLVWLGCGTALALHPHATVPLLPFRVPWLSVLLLSLAPCVLVTVVATSAKAKRAGLGFITEAVRSSAPARFLEGLIVPLERVLMLKPLREWLQGEEAGLVSGFSIFLISTLLFFGAESLYGIPMARGLRAGAEVLLRRGEDGPSQPTYEELCPGGIEPGQPAHRPWSMSLYSLWLGESGAGAIEAGCARPAHPIKGHPRIWMAEGSCEGSVRSLGVSVLGRPPSLLYQQAARFALAKAREGTLLGASPREDLRGGDFYLVEAESGPYVLIRSQKAIGSATSSSAPRRCEDYISDNYPYTIVPPGLIRIWLRISHAELVWPVLDGDNGGEVQDFAFLGADNGALVGHAECTSTATCTASFNGRVFTTPSSSNLSVESILRVVRGP